MKISKQSLLLNDYLLLTGFSRQPETLLRPPEAVDADSLRHDPNNEEIGQLERIVRYDRVLEGGNDSDCRIERIA